MIKENFSDFGKVLEVDFIDSTNYPKKIKSAKITFKHSGSALHAIEYFKINLLEEKVIYIKAFDPNYLQN